MRGLVELRDQLDQLLTGQLAEDIPVARLFVVPLTDSGRVARRLAELETQKEALSRRVEELNARLEQMDKEAVEDLAARAAVVEAEAKEEASAAAAAGRDAEKPPGSDAEQPELRLQPETSAVSDEGETVSKDADQVAREAAQSDAAAKEAAALEAADRASSRAAARLEFETRVGNRSRDGAAAEEALRRSRLELEIVQMRIELLKRWEKRLAKMSTASRQILPTLSEPRGALRNQAEVVLAFSKSLDDLAERIDLLEARDRGGMLVGFVSEQRAMVDDLADAARSYRTESARAEELSGALGALALRLESQGRVVAAQLYRAAVKSGGERVIDALFEEHLQSQRRLRKGISDVLTAPPSAFLLRSRTKRRAECVRLKGSQRPAKHAPSWNKELIIASVSMPCWKRDTRDFATGSWPSKTKWSACWQSRRPKKPARMPTVSRTKCFRMCEASWL